MEEEIEDLVGEVKYTDSSKSIATSVVYSHDFSDSSPERNDSSGKETYVIDCDESDSEDTEKTYSLHLNRGSTNMSLYPLSQSDCSKYERRIQSESVHFLNKYTSVHKCSIIAQETYTQTSKTIFELAETDGLLPVTKTTENLQTQTSFISITENKTVQYTIEVSDVTNNFSTYNKKDSGTNYAPILGHLENFCSNKDHSNTQILQIEDIAKDNDTSYDNNSNEVYEKVNIDLNEQEHDSDIENTSRENDTAGGRETLNYLCTVIKPNVDNDDIDNLYKKVVESIQGNFYTHPDIDNRKLSTLTPVTEESTAKSIIDITPNDMVMNTEVPANKIRKKTLADIIVHDTDAKKTDSLKLPPIKKNLSCPNSPHVSLLFTGNEKNRPLSKSGTLPCLFKSPMHRFLTNLDFESNGMACGESPDINNYRERNSMDFHLPPIQFNGTNGKAVKPIPKQLTKMFSMPLPSDAPAESICINEKIKALKINANKRNNSAMCKESRSPSPASSPGSEIAERSCDGLCQDIMKKLRRESWYGAEHLVEVVETLDSIPVSLEKFWELMTEQRVADLLRLVTSHAESPRTQVAKSACSALAVILQNTNYVKKPDFYESMLTLLNKSGSLSRPVRRAANLALDNIVCGVDLLQAVTAVCVHGVGHKSGLVRSASARLLVVCAALGHGGRSLLRARPASAATARQHLLRALSALLDDKSCDTRKFAERLYLMLRPLNNFEAFFLNDVPLETASRQMRKLDQANNTNGVIKPKHTHQR